MSTVHQVHHICKYLLFSPKVVFDSLRMPGFPVLYYLLEFAQIHVR